MVDGDPKVWLEAKDIIMTAGGLILTLGGLIGRIQIKRIDDAHEKIDKLENNHIGRAEHNAAIAALQHELREGFRSTRVRQWTYQGTQVAAIQAVTWK